MRRIQPRYVKQPKRRASRELLHIFQDQVQKSSIDVQIMLFLRYEKDLNNSQIGERLGVTGTTVVRHFKLFHEKVRIRYAPYEALNKGFFN